MSYNIEVPENVEAATAPETFDVLAFVAGTADPEDSVVIYTNRKAAYRLEKLLAEEAEKSAAAPVEDYETLGLDEAVEGEYERSAADELAINELIGAVENSAITISLKGVAPAALKAIEKKLIATRGDDVTDEEFAKVFNYVVAAKTLGIVTRADNAISDPDWTPETVEQFSESIHPTQWGKLLQAVVEINYSSALFDSLVDANFLSMR